MKKMLLLGAIGLLLVGASVAITLWVTGAFVEKAQRANAAENAVMDAPPPLPAPASRVEPSYITLDPPFTVTFNDPKKARFLQIKLDVATRDPTIDATLRTHMPVIRNGLVMLFSSQKPEDLLDREGKERLRQEALVEIQKVLQTYTGRPGIDEVYFTSFVMQ